ncbi:ADP-ribosylglycohydrolase family protein [Lutispora sp.]|uniref:ADP-ribosylglycohydrolase family protein n=1 Tax=Lutispora sp. TaxID=2828727 RepID=UPI002B2015AB|nr:ADP-ribosylglycohydrolase family protein [Lutispora sp.]MEA4963927.1 ADP-ribosylglycohydrolase family protein [Lutispora sp.]
MIDRAYGSLIGAAIGDAMGMPASFMSPDQIKKIYGKITDFMKPAAEQIAHGSLQQGEITDDTEESLIISSVLIEAKRFDADLFVEKMRRWAIDKKMLDSTVIGPSTRRFLEAIIKGKDYLEVGKKGDTNGGAMRAMPIGIFNHGRIEDAVADAIQSALPSHGSKPGVASACAVAAAVALGVEGGYTSKQIMEAAIYAAQRGEEAGFDIPAPSVAARIQLAIDIVDSNRPKSLEHICYELYRYIGSDMKSYESIPLSLGIFYAAEGDGEKGIIAAVNVGNDADTNASITGGICGAFSGAGSLNSKWIEEIKHRNKIDFMGIARALLD